MTATFDFSPLLPAGLPGPAAKWTGSPKYNFTGGNNDGEQIPIEGLIAAANSVMTREGRTLATYGLNSGPQGYRPLREFLVTKLKRDAGIECTADNILVTSGSLQALDLVNGVLLARGDTVLIEQDCYQGSINRLTRLGVTPVGIPLDGDGHADRRGGDCARRSQGSRHPPEIHLHHPDGAEPDRHDPERAAPRRTAQAVGRIRRSDLRGRLLRRSDLGRTTPAGALRHGQGQPRHPHRFVLQVDRAGAAGRLHRRRLERAVAHAGDQDRCRLGRARADGAGGILRAAFRQPRAGAQARASGQARNADGVARGEVRHRGGVRRSAGRHLPVGQAAGQRRHDEALSVGARGRRRDQSGAGMVGQQGAQHQPDAAVFREPDAEEITRGCRDPGGGLPEGVRRADAQRERGGAGLSRR